MESLFRNGKPDLVRDVIDNIIEHQSSNNALRLNQPLLRE